MARRFTTALVFLILLACGIRASAQAAGGKPTESVDTATPLTLGQSVVPLYGPWKFHVGDSPVEPGSGQLLWAAPDFDDSTWETVDLTPKGTLNPFRGSSGYVPGWGERGHPGYWGYAWYRTQVTIHAQPGEGLALARLVWRGSSALAALGGGSAGELFGFERTATIAAQSAEQISKTAQDFGQDDDITVLTLTRLAVGKQFASPQTATLLSPSIA